MIASPSDPVCSIETADFSHYSFLDEFRKSAVSDRLTLANVEWIEGDAAV